MSTLSEITFSILDNVRPLNQTNTDITEEIVKFYIKTVRAQLAKQTIQKNGVLGNAWFQSLGCVELVEADKSECCAFPTGCVILRTSVTIPKPIDSETSLLTRVGPVDITERPYQYIEFERVPFEGSNKYTRHFIKWFLGSNEDYVYLLMDENDYINMGLEVIHMHGAFENPEDLVDFIQCSTGESCFSDDSKYPIPDSMIPTLIEMVIKKFVQPQSQAPIDNSNDGKTNTETTVTKGS